MRRPSPTTPRATSSTCSLRQTPSRTPTSSRASKPSRPISELLRPTSARSRPYTSSRYPAPTTSIKDQIKYLETDAARSQGNTIKDTQIRQLKTSFTKQLQEYRQEEANYERRYREQIARQYRIVNPEATEAEVQEAMGADWGNEGVFQTAVSSATSSGTEINIRKLTSSLAQNQPHRNRQHRPRQRPRSPQRHPED